MPELPEVETIMRGLKPALEGARFDKVETRRKDLRFPFPERFAERLEGRRVDALSRRAKYILADLDDGEVLIMHLGMTGRFQVDDGARARVAGELYYDRPPDAKHDHVRFHVSNGFTVTFNDARRFGFMDLAPRAQLGEHRAFKDLGVEPLGNALDGGRLLSLFSGKTTSLKAALMDQRLIAGLGNIYVSEALHGAKLNPERLAGTLSAADADHLASAIRAVLEAAIALGGSTLRDFAHTDGSVGGFQERFSVYDREGEPCPRCGTTIHRVTQSNRSTFFCASCQV